MCCICILNDQIWKCYFVYIYKKRKKNLICNYINGFLKVKQTTLALSICQFVANFTIKKFQLAHVMLNNVFSRRCKIFYPIKAKFNSNILEVKGHVINSKKRDWYKIILSFSNCLFDQHKPTKTHLLLCTRGEGKGRARVVTRNTMLCISLKYCVVFLA